MKATKLKGFLTGAPIKIAAVQRCITWKESKMEEVLDSLKRGKIFFQAIWYTDWLDENDRSGSELYDGLQRFSTSYLIYICLKQVLNEKQIYLKKEFELKLADVVFSDPVENDKWLEAIGEFSQNNRKEVEIGRPLKNQALSNKKRILSYLNSVDANTLEDIAQNFLDSTWYICNIPEEEDAVDFYLNINSKGTVVDLPYQIKTLYKGNYDRFDNLIHTLTPESVRNKFFKDIPLLYSSNYDATVSTSKIMKWYIEAENKPQIEDLLNWAKLYMKIYKFAEPVSSLNFPYTTRVFLLKLELGNNPKKEIIKDIVLKFLVFAAPAHKNSGGNFHKHEEELFKNILKTISVDELKIEDLKRRLKDFYLKETRNYTNEKEIFTSYFMNKKDYFSSSSKRLTRYLLKIICEKKYPEIPIVLPNDDRTLEHLEKHSSGKDWVNDLGNLCLLNFTANQKNGVDSYEEKKSSGRYENSGCALTNEITKVREHFTEKEAIALKNDYVECLYDIFKYDVLN